ncbi:FAD-binding oxidoreductase [Pseudonocardia sp. GCM10023141]|uniref:FAD-binding oxidoreductase n=1 Tax=Pseudonocardia sp. GCM10023141 TaxID=3252653 RepID=UPI0036245F22
MTNHSIAALRTNLTGRALLPGDAGFDRAATPWNVAVRQPVHAVVEAATAADVAATVRFAAAAGLTVTAQAGGHGATGDADGVILLRTGGLDELTVRPAQRTARVGAGVSWGRVLTAAGEHGLVGLAGSSPVVSVVGYTLGGGLSWFGRKHGWAAESVRSLDVVHPDGSTATVTAGSDPDLFWALRGGGGDFALVTAMEFDLHPAPELFGGRLLWPGERAGEVMAAFREVTATAPDELTCWLELLHFPGGTPLVAVDTTYLGSADEGRDLLRALERVDGRIGDTRAVMPIGELGSITAEPTDPSPGRSRAGLLTAFDDEVAAALLERPIDPLLSVQIRHLGGAMARPSDTAAGPLAELYGFYLFGIPATLERAAAVGVRQQELVDALAARAGTRTPYTLLAPGQTAADAFPAESHARLCRIKQERDPRGTLCSNFPTTGSQVARSRRRPLVV